MKRGPVNPADVHAVFVYGTLLYGQPNYALVEHLRPLVEPARLPGWRLYGADHGYPYAVPEQGAPDCIGDVLTFKPADWPEAIRLLDRLEGVPHHYRRGLTVAQVPGPAEGSLEPFLTTCWIYTPAEGRDVRHLTPVPGNDWAAHVARPGRRLYLHR